MAQLTGEDADFTDIAVPAAARMARLPLAMSFWAICSAMFWMVVAATLAAGYGAVNAIIALLLSVVTFSLINGVIARFAIRHGLSVALFSRILFGAVGADLAALLLFATATWYAVFEGSVIAQAFSGYLAIPIDLAYLLVVIYSVALVFGSLQTWLDKLNATLLPFYLAGLISAVVLAIVHNGWSTAWLHQVPPGGAPPHGWLNCYAVFLGVWSMMMFTQEYARFGRLQDVTFHANFTFGWVFYVFTLLGNGLVGIFLIGTVPSSTPVSEVAVVAILLKLMGLVGLLFIWASQTRINTANFYVASLNLAVLAHRVGIARATRPICLLVVGVVVFIIMRVDIFSILLKALGYQGVFIEAWVAVALVYMLSPRGAMAASAPAAGAHAAGFVAWFGATVIGIVILNAGASLAVFSAPATALSAAAIYLAGLSLTGARRGMITSR